jgi:hypothetical protein
MEQMNPHLNKYKIKDQQHSFNQDLFMGPIL